MKYMVDLMLLMLIAVQAAVDISREIQWLHTPKIVRLSRTTPVNLLLPSIALILLLIGKLHFAITGLPTLGLLALYLILLFHFMHAYPYIILDDTETHICTHALEPNLVIHKSQITSAAKENSLIRIEYQPDELPLQRIVLDTRPFSQIHLFEQWLGLTPVIENPAEPEIKKAA